MKNKIPILFIVFGLLLLASCDQGETTLQNDAEAIEISDVEFHTTLSSDLNIDVYELEGYPTTEPLTFIPVGKHTQEQILTIHEKERG